MVYMRSLLRRLVGSLTVTAVVALGGGCRGVESRPATTLPQQATPTSVQSKPGLSRTDPLPQPVTPLIPSGWENVIAGKPEVPVDSIVLAHWKSQAQPGQTWARIKIQGTFVDSQATNGRPDGLPSLFRLVGAKGKQYLPLDSIGYNPFCFGCRGPSPTVEDLERVDLLGEEEPVVAPSTVVGFSYFLVDVNDTDLQVLFMDYSSQGEALWLGPPPQ